MSLLLGIWPNCSSVGSRNKMINLSVRNALAVTRQKIAMRPLLDVITVSSGANKLSITRCSIAYVRPMLQSVRKLPIKLIMASFK